METYLVIALLSVLYVLFQPNIVQIFDHQVVIQTALGVPVYELQHGYRVTLAGPFFKPYQLQKKRTREAIIRLRDYPALSKLAKARKRDETMVINWSVRDPWRVATRFGLPVDWNEVGQTVVLPIVLSTARTSRFQGHRSDHVISLEFKARAELQRRKLGLDIVALSLPDERLDLKTLPYGASHNFSRHLQRPRLPENLPIEKFTANINEIFARDMYVVKIDSLAVHYAVVDAKKFKTTFGSKDSSSETAKKRIEFMVMMGLISKISVVASDALKNFDPISIVRERGSQVEKQLLDWGIVIVEIGDEQSTYRISLQPQ